MFNRFSICSPDVYVMMSTGHLNYTAKYADINDNRVRMRQIAWYCLYFQVRTPAAPDECVLTAIQQSTGHLQSCSC